MKILKYFTLLAATVGIMSACTTDLEMVQTLPADQVVAPVLHELENTDVVITAETLVNTLAVSWDAAYFGDKIVPSYSVLISKDDVEVPVIVGITKLEATLTYEQINLAAASSVEDGGLGLILDVASDVKLRIGATIGNSYDTYYSEAQDIKITPTSAEKKYPMIYMPGSYQNWKPEDAATKFQVLYDFSGSGVFEGIADFGAADDEEREWKFTKDPNWNFDWGIPSGETPEAEAAEVTLINNDGGDRGNINIYTVNRYYHFSMDTGSGLLKKNYSFNQVGVVGEITSWADGQDKVMEFNAAKRRFWVDIENLSGQFKFRLDGKWDKNWGANDFGVKVSNGDGNLEAEAGNYRVYLYLSNPAELSYELSADMFGKEEPTGGNTTTPEPEPTETTYGLIGDFNGWGEPDVDLVARGDGWYVTTALEVGTDGKFLIRLNDAWSNKFGFAEADKFVTVDAKNALTAEGQDMWIAAGTYDFYFNPEASELYVMTTGAADPTLPSEAKAVKVYADVKTAGWETCNIYGWGDLGEFAGGWPGSAMTAEGDYFVYQFDATAYGKTVSVVLNNGSGDQSVDIKDIVLNDDVVITLTDNEGGKWNYTVNGEAPVTPEPPAVKEYGLVGTLTNWGTDPDIKFTDAGNGCHTLKGQALTPDDKFKIRLYGQWVDTDNYGLTEAGAVEINAATTLITSGSSADMYVAVAGTYDLYFYPETLTLYVMTEGTTPEVEAPVDMWTIMGDVNGTTWNSDIATELVDGLYVAKNVTFQDSWGEGANFKVLKNGAWMGSTAGGVHELGAAIAVSEGGGNITMNVTLDTPYDIYIDGANLNVYVVEAGATPAI